MTRRSTLVVAAAVAALSLGGCGENDASSDSGGEQPGSTGQEPRLLTWTDKDDNTFEAIVGGTLRVNRAGCFTVSGAVLVAPAGSRVVDAGNAIDIPQLGTRAIGDKVRGIGGYHTRDDAKLTDEQLRCIPEGSNPEFGFFTVAQ